MRIAWKITLANGIVFALFVMALATAISGITQVGARFHTFLERDQAAVNALNGIYAQGLQLGQALRNIVMDPSNQAAHKNFTKAGEAFDEAGQLALRLAEDDAPTAKVLREIIALRAEQAVIQKKIVAQASERETALTLINKEETPIWRQIRTRVVDLLAEKNAQIAEKKKDVLAFVDRMVLGALALGVAALAIGAATAYWLTRSIVRPLGVAVQAADQLASGNLALRVEVTTQDETGQLLLAIRNMAKRLSSIIGDVRGSAEQISSASRQVAATAQSLSQAAGEQAASVEETSASIEQMSASVSQNSENAKVTDGMASQAARQANEGGEAVKQTAEAMKQIAAKIGIIDDIAYQTNMLALNAAIEAARAGAYGKGFAVVAMEVRKLAERSQTAAREIGDVAASSVALSENAGKLLDEMVPAINKTSDLVQEISAASEEQSVGVAQINTAMGQLNQITQQNASSSEELAATAEQMSGQSEQLQQLMAFFKVGDGAAVPADTPEVRRQVRPALGHGETYRMSSATLSPA